MSSEPLTVPGSMEGLKASRGRARGPSGAAGDRNDARGLQRRSEIGDHKSMRI